ncbi:MAG: hypothetical protein ACREFC_05985, partial [Stellaceae bacterium]
MRETARWRTRQAEGLVFGIIAVMTALVCAAIVVGNGGYFTYALDAPYVHLTVADQIRAGISGANPGDNVPPVSSILYPFLLALLSYLGFGQFSPLAICFAATLAVGFLFCRLADEARIPFRRLRPPTLVLLSVALILSLNLIGLEFTGLEHSLHCALALGSLLGCVRFVRRGRIDWWWLVCVVIQPLVRFEAIALVLVEVAILLFYRRYWQAIGVAALCAILIGGFGLYLNSLGLSLPPNPVLQRSDILAAGLGGAARTHSRLILSLAANFKINLVSYGGAQIAAMTAVLLARLAAISRIDRVAIAVIVLASLVSLAQMAGGRFGSYSRYEIYVMAIDMASLGIVYRRPIASWCHRARLW